MNVVIVHVLGFCKNVVLGAGIVGTKFTLETRRRIVFFHGMSKTTGWIGIAFLVETKFCL